jgi:hypothetical protein
LEPETDICQYPTSIYQRPRFFTPSDVVRLEDFLKEAIAMGIEGKPVAGQGQVDRGAPNPW